MSTKKYCLGHGMIVKRPHTHAHRPNEIFILFNQKKKKKLGIVVHQNDSSNINSPCDSQSKSMELN